MHRFPQTFTFGETRLHAATTLLDIRVADAPELAEGDGFQIDGVSYVVQGCSTLITDSGKPAAY